MSFHHLIKFFINFYMHIVCSSILKVSVIMILIISSFTLSGYFLICFIDFSAHTIFINLSLYLQKRLIILENNIIILSSTWFISLLKDINLDNVLELCEILHKLKILFNFINGCLVSLSSHKKRCFVKA